MQARRPRSCGECDPLRLFSFFAGETPAIHQPIFCYKKSVDGSQASRLHFAARQTKRLLRCNITHWGISKNSFVQVGGKKIKHCAETTHGLRHQ
jgi:hypothetical protein